MSEVSYEEILTQDEVKKLKEEFPQIKDGRCYLDHAGATLYAKAQIDGIHSQLQSNLFGNPHSRNPSSSLTADAIDHIRARVLHHFGTSGDEYSVIFTSGTTSALKLLAESFRFNGGVFAYLEESHTSVVGMREIVGSSQCDHPPPKVYCLSKSSCEIGMGPRCSPTTPACPREPKSELKFGESWVPSTASGNSESPSSSSNSLFAFAAQCNFSGFKYPLEWISRAQAGQLNAFLPQISTSFQYVQSLGNVNQGTMAMKRNGQESHHHHDADESPRHQWYVALDAASFAGTNGLDLSLYPADFVGISFYKIFGFPTGLGALLVRNEAAEILEKKYFGGGTVNIAVPSKHFHVKRHKLHERFEDGTISFLSILALGFGFDTMFKLGRSLETISTRTFRLARYFYGRLRGLKYLNGQPVARIYSDTAFESRANQGPIVTFNLIRTDGAIIGYSEIEEIAYLHDLHLRYGCFCNPGACRRHLNLSEEDVITHYQAGHVCGDMRDIIDGKATGAIRVSIGYMTSQSEIENLLRLIHRCWILPAKVLHPTVSISQNFLNHRPDLLISPPGKPDPLLEPATDPSMTFTRKILKIFVYPIKSCAPFEVTKAWGMGPRGLLYDREWLIVNSFGVPLSQKRERRLCLLKPHIDIKNRKLILSMEGHGEMKVSLELAHSTQGLLMKSADFCASKVCGDTVSGMNCGEEVSNWLSTVFGRTGLQLLRMNPEHQRRPSKEEEVVEVVESLIGRFRPNFVISNETPYEEESWDCVEIGRSSFMSGGPCQRCATICTDQKTGQRTSEPFLTLSQSRERPNFGIHLYRKWANKGTQTIQIHDFLTIKTLKGIHQEPLIKSPLKIGRRTLDSID